jgi:cytochrome P450
MNLNPTPSSTVRCSYCHGHHRFGSPERRLLWRRRFIIDEPNAIRHVLLGNAANYTKSELSRRLLEPAFGRGLLTGEGETWRRHRCITAPAFDHRSIIGYAPAGVAG